MKFSIRDLLLVTMVVALAVGWWVERTRNARLQEALAKRAVDRNRGYVLAPLQSRGKPSDLDGIGLIVVDEDAKPPKRKAFGHLPTSSAPAPNPTKP
jgi:hypothetical protein